MGSYKCTDSPTIRLSCDKGVFFPHPLEQLLKQLGTESSSLCLVAHSKTTNKHSAEKGSPSAALNIVPSPGRWSGWADEPMVPPPSLTAMSLHPLSVHPFGASTAASLKHGFFDSNSLKIIPVSAARFRFWGWGFFVHCFRMEVKSRIKKLIEAPKTPGLTWSFANTMVQSSQKTGTRMQLFCSHLADWQTKKKRRGTKD